MGRDEKKISRAVPLAMTQRRDRGWSVVRVAGEVSLTTRAELGAYLDRATAGEALPPRLIVDVSAVAACDAVGLGALFEAHARVTQQYGGQLRLVCQEGRMLRILHITGMSRSVPVYLTVGQALTDAPALPWAPPGTVASS
jgi:anti-anti-sigma factor